MSYLKTFSVSMSFAGPDPELFCERGGGGGGGQRGGALIIMVRAWLGHGYEILHVKEEDVSGAGAKPQPHFTVIGAFSLYLTPKMLA